MGVVSLWQLLEPVRQTRSLQELKGQKIAIDLSAWIMGSKRVSVSSGYRNVYLRTILLRTLDLLKSGILPVFVCDGCIPKIKFDKVRTRCKGRSFGKAGPIFRDRSQTDTTQICFHLFECLGLPCLKSEGEGEALCAFLNKEQIVDGCLTSDSDVLLYGAQKVYRNYKKKNKVGYLECYDANDIHTQLKLDQRALVGLALLLGCDYNQLGVPGVGIKTAIRMIREMQRKNIDSLQRMLSWRTNQELQELQEKMDIFNETKHCEECLHIVVSHSQSGCNLCGDNINVSEDLEDCECSCHSFLQTFVSHEEEFKVRQKAMLIPDFPSEEVIEEFLIPTQSVDLRADVNWEEPNIADLQSFVSRHLHWNGNVLIKTLVPLFIQWKLNSSNFPCLEGLQPLRIKKKQQKNYQLLYEVEWSKMHVDIWTQDSTYMCSVDRDLFHKCFPEMVKVFEDSLLPALSVDRSKIKSISNLSYRVTRSALKKEGLTLSNIQDGNQDIHNENNEFRTHQYKMSLRKSKRLIEKNTEKYLSPIPVKVTRYSTRSSNNLDLEHSTESLDKWSNSIPRSFAGIKKHKNVNMKIKSVCSADIEESGRNVSVEMLSGKYSDLIGVCTVTLERIPIVSGVKADVQSISVNKEEPELGSKMSLGETLEVKDCVGHGKESASTTGEIENVLNCPNGKTETTNKNEKCSDGVDVEVVNTNCMDSILVGLDEGLEDSKRKDEIMEGSSVMDSIMEGSNSDDIMIDCSFGGVSIVEGSKSKDGMKNSSNGIDSHVRDADNKDLVMESSNGRNSIVESPNSNMMKNSSNVMDSILEGSTSKDVIMEASNSKDMMKNSSNSLDSIMEGSNNKDMVMKVLNNLNSILEGSNSKVMMEGSNDMDSIIEGSNSKDMINNSSFSIDTIVEGSNNKDAVMEDSNGMDSIVEGSNCKDVMMKGLNDMNSIEDGTNSKDVKNNHSNGIDSIVEGSNNKDAMMEDSNVMDSILEGSNSKDVMMEASNSKDIMKNCSNGMDSIVEGSNSKDVMEASNSKGIEKNSSNGMDSIMEGSNTKALVMEASDSKRMKNSSNGMDSIVEGSSSKDVMMEGSNSKDIMKNRSNVMDSIMEGSNTKALVMEASDSKDMKSSNCMDSIAEDLNSKDVTMEGSNGMNSIREVSTSKALAMEGSDSKDMMKKHSNIISIYSILDVTNSRDVIMDYSNDVDSIVEASKSNVVITECLNSLDSIVEDLNKKNVNLQSSSNMQGIE